MNKAQDPRADAATAAGDDALDLATAFSELQNLILDSPDVVRFLDGICELAASIVPGSHCAITLRRGDRTMSVGGTDELALRMDEVQYLHGSGPCLEAMRTATRVEVPDTAAETRWGGYGAYAVAHGVGSAISFPLVVDGESMGALNLFAASSHAFSEDDATRAQLFATQGGAALTILMRQARTADLDNQLREALATRAVIDQALGILMYSRKISSSQAFEVLRHVSQTTNRKVSAIAADIVEDMTGHPVESPRPLSRRD